jgi:hypothetical protein
MGSFWRVLASNPPLLRAVAAFNQPSRFAWTCGSAGSVRDFAPEGGQNPSAGPLAESAKRLSAFAESALASRPNLWRLMERPDADGDFWDFAPEPRRLMLLGIGDFNELAARFGAAAWGERLSLAVGGPAVRAMRSALGADLLDWAVGRGRLWLGDLAGIHRRGLSEPRDRAEIVLTGLRAVNVAWGDLPPELARKAPDRIWNGPALEAGDSSKGSGSLAARTFERLKRMLVTEVAPSWRACFY